MISKRLTFLILLFAQIPFAFSQEISFADDTLEFNSPLSNSTSISAIGVDWIKLSPGFSYTAASEKKFTGSIYSYETLDTANITGGPSGTVGQLVGTDGVVGAIPGQLNVTPTGGATYSIPIECPRGVNGMTPSVSLVYNSQTGDGVAGYGWNIAGSSVISRTGKNIYYDDEVSLMLWNDTDPLVLDGQRMEVITDYGDSIKYGLIENPKVKIMAYDCNEQHTKYFKVRLGDGKVYTYEPIPLSYRATNYYKSVLGNCSYPASTLIIQDDTSSYVLNWYLTKIIDPFENFINFSYRKTASEDLLDSWSIDSLFVGKNCSAEIIESYSEMLAHNWDISLSEIAYGHAQDTAYSILFDYESSGLGTRVKYLQGIKIRNSIRLKDIKAYNAESQLLKQYSLSYYTDPDNHEYLKDVQLEGLNGDHFNKTAFTWDDQEISMDSSATFVLSTPSIVSTWVSDGYQEYKKLKYTADLNGDNLSDFVVKNIYYKREYNFFSEQYDFFFKAYCAVFINSGITSNLSVNWSEEYDLPTLHGQNYWDLPDEYPFKFGPKLFYDVDNDNRDEYIIEGNRYSSGGKMHVKYTVKEFNESTNSMVEQETDNIIFDFNTLYQTDKLSLIPLNLTGKNDKEYFLLQEVIAEGEHDFYLSINDSCFKLTDSEYDDIFFITTLDYNGDGKTDFLFADTESLYIYNYSSATESLRRILTYNNLDVLDQIRTGDFNGDGNTDLLVSSDDYASDKVFFSTGTSLTSYYYTVSTSMTKSLDSLQIYDVDGDGRDDVIEKVNNKINVYISKEDELEQVFTKSNLLSENISNICQYDNDNIPDLYMKENNKFYSISPNKTYHSLRCVTNGFGNQINLNYGFESYLQGTVEDVFEEGNSDFSPYLYLKSFAKTISSAVQGNDSIKYKFYNPLIHLKGQGFIGFGKKEVDKYCGTTNAKTIQTFKLVEKIEDEAYDFLPDSTKTYVNETQLSESYNDYDVVEKNNVKYCVPDSIIQKDLLTQTKVVKSFDNYDDYLNPGKSVTKYYQDYSTLIATDSVAATYNNSINSYLHILGLPDQINEYKKRPGESDYSQNKEFHYLSNGSLDYSTIYKNTNEEIKKEYTYDNFGNSISSTITATNDSLITIQDNKERLSSINYSDDGLFVVSKTNPIGFVDSMIYNSYGQLVKSIDVDNLLETTYEYNNMGGLINTDYPGNGQKIQGLRWASGNELAPANALYYSYSQEFGSAPTYTFYDKDGKEIRSVVTAFNGDPVFVDKYYDIYGRDSLVSMPYYQSSPTTYFTRYYYDSFGRPDSIVNPDSRFTTYSYNGRITSISSGKGQNSHQSIQTVNALGETIISEDDDGKKVYTYYYSSGLPKEMVLNGGSIKVELEYDKFGNRTNINDPNAGETFTYYNNFGELVSQIDPKGNESQYTYDKLGRVLSESVDNNLKTYHYDQDFVGAVSSINQSSPSDSLVYEYDDLGRAISSTEFFDGLQINNEFEYDYFGRLKSQTYPNDIELSYSYNTLGDLVTISGLGNTLWQCNQVNELGAITSFKQGSKSSSIDYDDFGNLESQSYASGAREFNYGFDDFMNLDYREDDTYSLKEEFSYDDLNRLETSEYYENSIYQTENVSIQYDDNGMGNIISKAGVSDDIRYGENAGPNALTGVINPDPAFNPWPQHIDYTAFNKVLSIVDTLDNNDTLKLVIDYGFDNQRRKSTLSLAGVNQKTKYFFGDYEKITDENGQKEYLFVNSPIGLCAIIECYEEDSEPIQKVWHTYTDHLGSLVYLENADNENETLEYSYDAWGNPRKHSDWLDSDLTDELIADRGFTGHEHLTEFGLINMNGRVYDPILGRFLSPDPFVQLPGNVDGFNRYAYCLNNPLLYTDPSGESFLAFAVGFVVMSYLSGVADNNGELNIFQWDPKQTDFVKMGFMGLLGGFGANWIEGLSLGSSTFTAGAQLGAGIGGPTTFIGFNYSSNNNFSLKWTNNLGNDGEIPLRNLSEGNFNNISNPSPSNINANFHNSMEEWRSSNKRRAIAYPGYLRCIKWEYEFDNTHVFTLNYFEIGGDILFGGSGGIGWVKDEFTGKRRFIYGYNEFLSTTPSISLKYNRINYYYSGSSDYSLDFLEKNTAFETNLGGGPDFISGGGVFHRFGPNSPMYGNGAFFEIGLSLFPVTLDYGMSYSFFRKRYR